MFSTFQRTHKQACNFVKGGGLKAKMFCLKNASIGSRAKQSGATKSSHIDGSPGVKPFLLGDFLIFSKKVIISTPLGSHFVCV